MAETEVTRHQTIHHGERLASSDFTARMDSARLTEGGTLTWDISGGNGTFTWSSPLYIEFPTMPWKIKIDINGASPGSVASVAVGETLYIEVPFINDSGSNVDDVFPAGTWDVTTNPTLTLAYTAVEKSAGPIPTEGVEGQRFFFIGTRIENDQFVLHNDCILSDGVPGAIGSGSGAGSRVIIAVSGAEDWSDFGFLYPPNQRMLHVYVNGVYQKPARYDDSVVDGYFAIANADYKETYQTGGGAGDTLYGGIAWSTGPPDMTPATGEIVTIVLGGGAMGPPGPPGPPGGFQDAYDNGQTIDLDYDGTTHVQDPVIIDEGLTDISASPSEVNGSPNPSLGVIKVRRSTSHPDSAVQDKVAFVVDSIGNIGGCGLFLFNPHELTTLENELADTGPGRKVGIYYAGMDEKAGAATATDKFIIHFLSRAVLDTIGVTDPTQLQILRQNADAMDPVFVAADSPLIGQFAVNQRGEVATGHARDFIRWHVLDVKFPSGVGGGDVFETDFTIDDDVIEDDAEFIGGFATNPIDDDDYEVFYHSNPTNAYVGGNPYELKLAIETSGTPPGVTRKIKVTYGKYLVDYTSKIVLFFSGEYSTGAGAPDEGQFNPVPP